MRKLYNRKREEVMSYKNRLSKLEETSNNKFTELLELKRWQDQRKEENYALEISTSIPILALFCYCFVTLIVEAYKLKHKIEEPPLPEGPLTPEEKEYFSGYFEGLHESSDLTTKGSFAGMAGLVLSSLTGLIGLAYVGYSVIDKFLYNRHVDKFIKDNRLLA
jgi:hypothetical protein